MATPILHPNTDEQLKLEIKKKVAQLVNSDLKDICKLEGLPVSGKKIELQLRIHRRLDYLVSHGDSNSVSMLKFRVNNPQTAKVQARQHLLQQARSSSSMQPTSIAAQPPPPHAFAAAMPPLGNNLARAPMHFKQNPFYTHTKYMTQFLLLPCMNHRNTQSTVIKLTARDIADMRTDSGLRMMLYCGEKQNHITVSDVAFPAQIEIKVNDQEIKTNTKGIKGKPGSVKPVDITPFLKKQSDVPSRVQISYALTNKVGLQAHARDAD